MSGRRNHDVRPHEDVVPKRDQRAVEHDQIMVRVHAPSDFEIVAVVAIERRLEVRVSVGSE